HDKALQRPGRSPKTGAPDAVFAFATAVCAVYLSRSRPFDQPSPMTQPELDHDYSDIRDAVAKLCAQFPGEYWRKLDRQMAYPTAFVNALTEAGYLSVLIPEEYGGAGLK